MDYVYQIHSEAFSAGVNSYTAGRYFQKYCFVSTKAINKQGFLKFTTYKIQKLSEIKTF